jgi:flagellar hook-associated protein 3 FlgL
MRVTSNMMVSASVYTLQQTLAQIQTAQQQVSTGLRIQAMSDDPGAAAQLMQSNGTLRALDQYKRNIQAGTARSQAEETALNSLTDLLTRAKELAISQASDTADAGTRLTTKSEVDQLLDEARSLGNTQFENGYLFGGFDSKTLPFPTTTPPFTNPTAPTGQPKTEIGPGQYSFATHDGQQVFVDTGVLQSLSDLSNALGSNDATAIQQSIGSIGTAFDGVQRLLGDVGAWQNGFQVASSNIDALSANVSAFKSNLSDADMEQSMTELLSRQNTYQAAMLATSRIMSLTFTDYLR